LVTVSDNLVVLLAAAELGVHLKIKKASWLGREIETAGLIGPVTTQRNDASFV
jgi:hypothetical protein